MAIKDFPVDYSANTITPDSDYIPFSDVSDSNNLKKDTLTNIIATVINDA